MRKAIATLSVLLLAGCSWSTVIVTEMDALPPGKSFGYQNGYEDGCESAIARRGGLGFDKPSYKRDEERMKTEPDYAGGWTTGEQTCRERYAGLVRFDPKELARY